MRRILETLGAACLLTVLLVAPASGQEGQSPHPLEAVIDAFEGPAGREEQAPNPLDVLIDAFESPEGQEFVARFTKQPVPGVASLMDPIGDLVHSTGQEPGFTPDHLDITTTSALELDPGPIGLFTPTDANGIWAPMGALEVDPPNYEPFHTFAGEQVHDGAQYENGALLFGFTLIDTPPSDPPGRCEFVVWINDVERGATFVTNPNFPLDPAGGTNLAVGLALNPTDGPGLRSGFAVELQESGGFARVFEADIRGFITPGYVGILAPARLIGDIAAANFYAFCAEEDFIFEPEQSGADQTGLTEISADDFGTVQFEARDLPPESTTTTTEPTTTAAPPPDATTAPPVVGDEEDEAGTKGFAWWFLLTAGGVGLAIVGWWLYSQDDDPCRELLDAWQVAEDACRQAQQKAAEAAGACESAELELESLEAERDEVCKAWPPACWETEEGDWIEDERGNRITSRDIHMRKVALGEVWDDYRAGKLSAAQVEAQWQHMDTPEFREEMRRTDQAFEDLLSQIEADLADAQREVGEACQRAIDAQEAADGKCGAAAEARAAYDECVGRAVAAAAPEGESEEDDPGPDSLSGSTAAPGEAADPCDGQVGKRELRRVGEVDRARVFVDFSVIMGVEEASERNVGDGEKLALDLNDLATELDFAGDLLNARSAGLHIGGAIGGYTAGKYTVMASGVVKGGAGTAMATTGVVPDVPTTPLQASIEGLETLTRVGGVIAGKVTEWMTNIQIMTVRLTMFYQDITATPYEVWECRIGEGWVCSERIWEIEVSRLNRIPGKDRSFTVNSDVRRREFQRVIRGMSQRAASTVKRDAEELARWRTDHEPGQCL